MPVESIHGSFTPLNTPKPRDTMILPIPIISAVTTVAFLRPILQLSSNVLVEISKNVNKEEITANIRARKKQHPIIRPPGSLPKMSVITRNTSPGPLCTSTPPANAEGIITNPAKIAAPVSQMDTRIASLFKLFSFGMLAPKVSYIPQPIPTEKRTCVAALANTEKLNLLKSGRR